MRPLTRAAGAAFTLGVAALAFAPAASAGAPTTLTPTVEAWYQPDPTCGTAIGCLPVGSVPALPVAVPLSPFPAGSLDVGYTGGQETARTYLALPTSALSGTVTTAVLDVPLDTSSADGSMVPETAHLQACLWTGTITAVDGAVSEPPTALCTTSAPLTYVATPAPHLTADLGKLGPGLLTTDGIVLLPDATTVTATDAWRVVFSAHDRSDAAATPPATVTLALAAPAAPAPAPAEDQTLETAPEPVTEAGVPVDQGSLPVLGLLPPVPAAPPGTVTAPEVAAPTDLPQELAVTEADPLPLAFPYSYPGVWLLPLALLLVAPAAFRALSRDLTPERRTGAAPER